MMRSRGYEVYHYGVEGSESNATKDIQLLTKDEWNELRIQSFMFLESGLTRQQAEKKNKDNTYLINGLANFNAPLCVEFNKRLKVKLLEHYRGIETDVVCCPLGQIHDGALKGEKMVCLENGIGYSDSYLNYRVFESHTVFASSCQSENKNPNNYYFVIPNFYNIQDFTFSPTPKDRIGFFGRLQTVKGLGVIVEIARRFPNTQFLICGQGDPAPFLQTPNIIYIPPIHGKERSDFLGSCCAMLCPSEYIEPFCGVSVEAQICGTPVISSDHGAFADNVEQFKTGLRCHTLADYCYGVELALNHYFDRKYIRERAVNKFDMYKLAVNYDYTIKSILDIHKPNVNGWYAKKSHMDLFQPPKLYLYIVYYGSFPNYFQLYLDSLKQNELLTVVLITDIPLDYDVPKNLIHVHMPIEEVKQRARDFLKIHYPDKSPHSKDLITTNYKLVDFKIIFPLLFKDFTKATPNDFVGWGDIDVIYGNLSNFIKFEEKYDIIGGYHGHFTAIKNTQEFKHLFKKIPNYFELCTDNSRTFITDEIAYREPLMEYIKENNLKMCFLNFSMCDIVPPCFYGLFRTDEEIKLKESLNEKIFFNNSQPTKNIKYIHYDHCNTLTTYYDDGTQSENSYCHLQKRKMDMYLDKNDQNDKSYYINESTFTKNPLNIFFYWNDELPLVFQENIDKIKKDNPLFTIELYNDERARKFISDFVPDALFAYDNLIPMSYKSDVFRFCILYVYGGIYLDVKIKILAPLIDYINKDYFVDDEYPNVLTGFMSSNKNNVLFKNCIDTITNNIINKNYGNNPWAVTGPGILGYNYYRDFKKRIDNFSHVNRKIYYDTILVGDFDYEYISLSNEHHYTSLWEQKKIFKNENNESSQIESKDIVLMSSHYPKTVYFAQKTKESIEKYTKIHGYGFYYEEEEPTETNMHQLHYYRSYVVQKCAKKYSFAKWFVWLDSDVYVNNYDMKIENHLNLNEDYIYHLFYEKDWGCYPINTGVKFIHRNALKHEEEIWSLRNTPPWNEFPFEQKNTYENILPKIVGQYKIHDPYVLNCIVKAYPDKLKYALFHHMCNMTETERNNIINKHIMNKHIQNETYTLNDLVDNSKTDKDTVHSYLPLYESLLQSKKNTAKNVLEIGIGDFNEKNGGSIKMWKDYFTNATIYGLDIIPRDRVMDELLNDNRVVLYTSIDAYNEDFFITHFLNKIKCDFILDDGLHTLDSMKQFIQLYSQIMTDDGILIIEDVQSWDWIDILKNEVPDHLKPFIKTYDLRPNKNRYDDIVFTIDKSNR
jgi:mannosyltransferase OCH1-like enzyme